ncbi:MAG: hypothetical protein EA426_10485 [Spirochaetaceae bacterium]|nr:MAG: hypothetical protein EA426_10485 [Spirochaetaceae bacterium]
MTTRRLLRIAALIATAAVLVAACRSPLGPNSSSTGTLRVAIDPDGVESALSPLTITPGIDTTVAQYDVTGTAASGASFSRSLAPGATSFEETGLLEGIWTVRIDAKNASDEIVLTGSASVLVSAGETASASIVLTSPAGHGTFVFTLEWPTGLLDAPDVDSSRAPVDNPTSTTNLTFAVDQPNAIAQYSGEWPSGFYIFSVSLRDGALTVWADTFAVQIIAGAVTTETLVLTADDLALPEPGTPGAHVWSFTVGSSFFGSVWSSPALAPDGTVYIGSDDDRLYAINPDGTQLWSRETGGRVYSSPAVGADGTVYVGSYDGFLYAIDPADGTVDWQYQTGGWIRSSPAIGADGVIYVGSDDGFLHAIDPVTEDAAWTFNAGGRVHSSPAIGADGTIYVGSYGGRLYAVNANGTERWFVQTGDWVHGSPAIAADGTVYVGSYDGFVYAINGQTGAVLWSYDAGSWVPSSPAIGPDGTVYIGVRGNALHAIDPATETALWTFPTGPGGVYSSPAVGADGTVYFGSYDGNIYAVDSDGDPVWNFPTGLGGVFSSPVIGPDGVLYVGGRDGNVYAITSGSSGPASSAWPMFGRDAARTSFFE